MAPHPVQVGTGLLELRRRVDEHPAVARLELDGVAFRAGSLRAEHALPRAGRPARPAPTASRFPPPAPLPPSPARPPCTSSKRTSSATSQHPSSPSSTNWPPAPASSPPPERTSTSPSAAVTTTSA